jgi:Tol biopolymer transport system component
VQRVSSTSPLTAVPVTALSGQEVAPTFSPDGSQIAFAWAAEGPRDQFDLYVKVIGRENLLRLTSRPAEFISPAWSPDGRQIAFARLAPGDSAIYLISPLGGSERKLADAALQYYVQAMLSWSPDGKSLAGGSEHTTEWLNHNGLRIVPRTHTKERIIWMG